MTQQRLERLELGQLLDVLRPARRAFGANDVRWDVANFGWVSYCLRGTRGPRLR